MEQKAAFFQRGETPFACNTRWMVKGIAKVYRFEQTCSVLFIEVKTWHPKLGGKKKSAHNIIKSSHTPSIYFKLLYIIPILQGQ